TGASSRRQVAPACLRSDSCESLEEQYLGVPDFFEGRGTPYASIAGGAPGEGGGEALTRQAKPRGQAPPGAAAGGESPHAARRQRHARLPAREPGARHVLPLGCQA